MYADFPDLVDVEKCVPQCVDEHIAFIERAVSSRCEEISWGERRDFVVAYISLNKDDRHSPVRNSSSEVTTKIRVQVQIEVEHQLWGVVRGTIRIDRLSSMRIRAMLCAIGGQSVESMDLIKSLTLVYRVGAA